MTDIVTTDDWRWGLAHSRMLLLVWSPLPQHQKPQREKLALAMQLGKPIRLLVLAPDRLPEDLCAGYADVAAAQVTNETQAFSQVRAWLRDLKDVR